MFAGRLPIIMFTVKLYKLMETLGYDKLRYVGTDYIMFIQNKNDKPLLDTSTYLGELTNEISEG